MPVRIIFIRHGQTAWNKLKRYCGSSDIDIDPQGVRQIKRSARSLQGIRIAKVYASPALRAVHSARIIFGRRRIIITPGLREIHFGVLEGITHDEALDRYPKVYPHWLVSRFSSRIPQAESAIQFTGRVKKSLKGLISQNAGKTIAVVTHAGPIKVILSLLSNKPAWKIGVKNASLTVIDFPEQKNGKFTGKVLRRLPRGEKWAK